MLHDICALLLEFITQSEHAKFSQGSQNQEAKASSPTDDKDDSHDLDTELVTCLVTPMKQSIASHSLIWIAKQTTRQYAPNSTSTMNWERIDNIINLELLKKHRGCLVQQTSHEANDDSFPRLDKST